MAICPTVIALELNNVNNTVTVLYPRLNYEKKLYFCVNKNLMNQFHGKQ